MNSKSFMVFPVKIRNGWMKWLLITNNRSLGEVMDDLGTIGVKARVDRVTLLGGKGVLTDRQEEVARRALDSGYFEFPRRTDSSGLARELGVSLSTLSEILRAAERRIFAEYFKT